MYQGETITTEIRDLPVPIDCIKSMNIIFHTITKTLLEKTLDDCVINGDIIECTLKQEETLKFPCGPIEQTIVVLCKDGSRFERCGETLFVGRTAKCDALHILNCGHMYPHDSCNSDKMQIESYVKVVEGGSILEVDGRTIVQDADGVIRIAGSDSADDGQIPMMNGEHFLQWVSPSVLQSDWNEVDDTTSAFIKNKPLITSDDDTLDVLCEYGYVNTIANSSNAIFTDNSGRLYTL